MTVAMVHMNVENNAADILTELSQSIWGSAFRKRMDAINAMGDREAYFEFEDFIDFPSIPASQSNIPVQGWNAFTSAATTFLDGGVANVSAVAVTGTTDNYCAALAKAMTAVRITNNSGRKVAFECRVKFSSIADTKNGAFFGLWQTLIPTATSHIGDDGALVDSNFIGFHRLEGDGDYLNFVYKADGQTQQSFDNSQVLVADTWVKAGFLFDGVTTLKVFFNGAEYTTARLDSAGGEIAAVTFPSDINLGPTLIPVKNATSSSPGTNYLDWAAFGFTYAAGDGYA